MDAQGWGLFGILAIGYAAMASVLGTALRTARRERDEARAELAKMRASIKYSLTSTNATPATPYKPYVSPEEWEAQRVLRGEPVVPRPHKGKGTP